MKQYTATPTDRGVGLTCPRKDCGGRFLVNMEKLEGERRGKLWHTAPCPYCFRVNLLPGHEAPNGLTGVDEDDF